MGTDSARRQYQRSGPRFASDLTGAEFAAPRDASLFDH
jgi:hypothetical protein